MTTVTLAADVTGDVIAVAFLLVLMPCLYIDMSFFSLLIIQNLMIGNILNASLLR